MEDETRAGVDESETTAGNQENNSNSNSTDVELGDQADTTKFRDNPLSTIVEECKPEPEEFKPAVPQGPEDLELQNRMETIKLQDDPMSSHQEIGDHELKIEETTPATSTKVQEPENVELQDKTETTEVHQSTISKDIGGAPELEKEESKPAEEPDPRDRSNLKSTDVYVESKVENIKLEDASISIDPTGQDECGLPTTDEEHFEETHHCVTSEMVTLSIDAKEDDSEVSKPVAEEVTLQSSTTRMMQQRLCENHSQQRLYFSKEPKAMQGSPSMQNYQSSTGVHSAEHVVNTSECYVCIHEQRPPPELRDESYPSISQSLDVKQNIHVDRDITQRRSLMVREFPLRSANAPSRKLAHGVDETDGSTKLHETSSFTTSKMPEQLESSSTTQQVATSASQQLEPSSSSQHIEASRTPKRFEKPGTSQDESASASKLLESSRTSQQPPSSKSPLKGWLPKIAKFLTPKKTKRERTLSMEVDTPIQTVKRPSRDNSSSGTSKEPSTSRGAEDNVQDRREQGTIASLSSKPLGVAPAKPPRSDLAGTPPQKPPRLYYSPYKARSTNGKMLLEESFEDELEYKPDESDSAEKKLGSKVKKSLKERLTAKLDRIGSRRLTRKPKRSKPGSPSRDDGVTNKADDLEQSSMDTSFTYITDEAVGEVDSTQWEVEEEEEVKKSLGKHAPDTYSKKGKHRAKKPRSADASDISSREQKASTQEVATERVKVDREKLWSKALPRSISAVVELLEEETLSDEERSLQIIDDHLGMRRKLERQIASVTLEKRKSAQPKFEQDQLASKRSVFERQMMLRAVIEGKNLEPLEQSIYIDDKLMDKPDVSESAEIRPDASQQNPDSDGKTTLKDRLTAKLERMRSRRSTRKSKKSKQHSFSEDRGAFNEDCGAFNVVYDPDMSADDLDKFHMDTSYDELTDEVINEVDSTLSEVEEESIEKSWGKHSPSTYSKKGKHKAKRSKDDSDIPDQSDKSVPGVVDPLKVIDQHLAMRRKLEQQTASVTQEERDRAQLRYERNQLASAAREFQRRKLMRARIQGDTLEPSERLMRKDMLPPVSKKRLTRTYAVSNLPIRRSPDDGPSAESTSEPQAGPSKLTDSPPRDRNLIPSGLNRKATIKREKSQEHGSITQSTVNLHAAPSKSVEVDSSLETDSPPEDLDPSCLTQKGAIKRAKPEDSRIEDMSTLDSQAGTSVSADIDTSPVPILKSDTSMEVGATADRDGSVKEDPQSPDMESRARNTLHLKKRSTSGASIHASFCQSSARAMIKRTRTTSEPPRPGEHESTVHQEAAQLKMGCKRLRSLSCCKEDEEQPQGNPGENV